MASAHYMRTGAPLIVTLPFRQSRNGTYSLRKSRCANCHCESPRILFSRDSQGGEIIYQQVDELCYEEAAVLLKKVGWPPRQRQKLQIAVENSFFLATLRAHSSKPEQDAELIGLARVVSDGAFNAQIWDVIIDPNYQGKGLGKQMIQEIVSHLIQLDIRNITTFAEKAGTRFYEKVGFQCDPDGVRGMFWRQMQ